jgi:hypothetical protein
VCGIGFIACRASDEFRSQFEILYRNRPRGGNGPSGPRGGHEDLQWVRTRRNGIFSARWGATMSSICTGSGGGPAPARGSAQFFFLYHGESSRLLELSPRHLGRDAKCEMRGPGRDGLRFGHQPILSRPWSHASGWPRQLSMRGCGISRLRPIRTRAAMDWIH